MSMVSMLSFATVHAVAIAVVKCAVGVGEAVVLSMIVVSVGYVRRMKRGGEDWRWRGRFVRMAPAILAGCCIVTLAAVVVARVA